MGHVTEHEVAREVRRLFRRFTEPESYAAPTGEGAFGLFIARNRWQRPVALVEARLWSAFERRDLVRPSGDAGGRTTWVPSEVGIAYWRRIEGGGDPFRGQHQMRERRIVSVGGEDATVDVNETETPLGWLRRRKGADGKSLIGDAAFDAGERLRSDFTLAQMNPRVTIDWVLAMGGGSGRRRPRDPAEISDGALAARERVAQALGAVGPGLSEILIEVCCRAHGLEEAERRFGWPQRSAKIVLQIALDRLAAHYGSMDRAPSSAVRRPAVRPHRT